jgi:diaminopimelate epimerase
LQIILISFRKYHCLGRDFILLDNRDGALEALQSTEISRFCARRFGVGASGVLRVDKCSKTEIVAKSFNFNGVLAEFNAVDAACVAAFAKDLKLLTAKTSIEINEQITGCKITSNHESMHIVNVRILDPIEIKHGHRNFVMDYGAQFYMIPIDDVSTVNVLEKGREFAHNKRFPKGANITFYQPNHGHLEIRHYEYKIDQETYTNGLCAIGAALSHAQNMPISNCFVRTKGGEMQVSFARSERTFYNVELQVLVNAVYCGTIN